MFAAMGNKIWIVNYWGKFVITPPFPSVNLSLLWIGKTTYQRAAKKNKSYNYRFRRISSLTFPRPSSLSTIVDGFPLPPETSTCMLPYWGKYNEMLHSLHWTYWQMTNRNNFPCKGTSVFGSNSSLKALDGKVILQDSQRDIWNSIMEESIELYVIRTSVLKNTCCSLVIVCLSAHNSAHDPMAQSP